MKKVSIVDEDAYVDRWESNAFSNKNLTKQIKIEIVREPIKELIFHINF